LLGIIKASPFHIDDHLSGAVLTLPFGDLGDLEDEKEEEEEEKW